MARKQLAPVPLAVSWTSLIGALDGVLRALGQGRPSHELMGVTGFAFRFALPQRDGVLGAGSSAAAVDFERALPLLRNVGRLFTAISAPRSDRDFGRRREQALAVVRRSIDRGLPAIAYDIHVPEFGVILGYDESAQTLTVGSLMSGQYGATLTESRWPVPERDEPLIVLLPGGRTHVKQTEALAGTLRFALAYAEDGEPGDPTHALHGLAALARWRTAFADGELIDPAGNARAIQTLQSARHDAARFLRDAAAGQPEAHAALESAAAAYSRTVLTLSRMATLFPYPAGGDVAGEASRIAAVSALHAVETEERTALEQLRVALDALPPATKRGSILSRLRRGRR